MAADVAQEIDQVEIEQPVGIVDHDGVGWAVAEAQELRAQLHHHEIDEIARKTGEKGLTLVPLRVYFKEGRAKVELGLGRGKRNYDKRQALAARDAQRETERALRGRPD